RTLGGWYRTSLREVKNDLAVYVFKGVCRGEHEAVHVISRFPVDESLNDYHAGKILFGDIHVSINAPVTAVFDPVSQAYSFDLPYLFRVSERGGTDLYTLNPPRLSDRYARNVRNHWDCKLVSVDDVSYRFLICHVTVLSQDANRRNNGKPRHFGMSAYSILSDGKEGSSSVRLTLIPSAETPDEAK